MYSNTLFQVCWLRESSAGHLDSDLGSAVPADRLELALIGSSSARRAAGADAVSNPAAQSLESVHVYNAFVSLERVQSLPKWLLWRLTAFFGPLNTEERVREARRNYEILTSTCDRIREAAGSRPWVELYLPYFTRRDWKDRFEIFSNMEFVERNGWIQAVDAADPMSLREIVLRVSAGVFHPTVDQGLPLRSYYNKPLAQPWVLGLASRWDMEHIPAEQHTKAIDIRLSGEAIEGWRKSPRPHHGRHHATWARVALAIQWIMRRWNSALHMSSPEGVADVAGTIQVLMYNCFRPWSENVRSELSYDVLDERVMRNSFEKAAKRLVTALQQIAEVLEKTGQSELASEYRGPVDDIHLHAARLADRAFRSKSVRGMLAAEGAILNGLMRYSQDVKAADSPRDIRQVADALVTVFNDQMPRIFKGKPAEHLAAAIFLEATAAMHIAVGGAPPMEVRIQSADGTWFDNNRQPISDAA